MKSLHDNPYSAHQDISLLLPWYVNKTLHGAEVEKVENHIKVCLTCRRELTSLYRLSAAVRQDGHIDSAAMASFSRLKKRIHTADESDEAESKSVDLSARSRGYNKKFNISLSAFAMAAVLVLSVLLPRFIDTRSIPTNDYRTLSDTKNVQANGHHSFSVIFADGTGRGQIDKMLASVHGRIIDGPSAQGIYTVAIDRKLAPEEVLNVVVAMRKDSRVIFTEPAYEVLSSANSKDSKQ